MTDRILDGDLQTLGLQATLKMLALGSKTGQLHVVTMPEKNDTQRSSQELSVYLRKGSIVALESRPPADPPTDLLEMLKRLRRLHPRDADEIRERSGNQLPPILAMLVERNIMTPAEQQQRIEFAIIQEIARALRWEHGTFEFLANVRVVDATLTPLTVDHILLEAIRLVDEWKAANTTLTRASVPRWLSDFNGNVSALSLTRDDINILILCNGHNSVAAIAYAVLLPEPRVAQRIEALINVQLVEVVDDQMERQLEHSLANALTVSQGLLKQDPRQSPEQRLLMLVNVMGTCVNKLLSHHSSYARAIRGRNTPRAEAVRYLESVFMPILIQVQQRYEISEAVGFHDGQIDYAELMQMPNLVRGDKLEDFIWEYAQAFQLLMNETFRLVVLDELGPTRGSRRFMELWETFAQEIAGEMERHQARRNNPPRRGGLS